jgi:hypothetical protein
MGNRQRMTTQAPSGERVDPADLAARPPMPSIAASALLESRMFIERTRRSVAAWLSGSYWTE